MTPSPQTADTRATVAAELARRLKPLLLDWAARHPDQAPAIELILTLSPEQRAVLMGTTSLALRLVAGSSAGTVSLLADMLVRILLEDPETFRRLADAETLSLISEADAAIQAAPEDERADMRRSFSVKVVAQSDFLQSPWGQLAVATLASAIVEAGSGPTKAAWTALINAPTQEAAPAPPPETSPFVAALPGGFTITRSGDGTYQLYQTPSETGKVKDIDPNTPLLIDRIEGEWVSVGLIENGQLTLSGWTRLDAVPMLMRPDPKPASSGPAKVPSIKPPKLPPES